MTQVTALTKSVSSLGGGITTVLQPVSARLSERFELEVIGLKDGGELVPKEKWGATVVSTYPAVGPSSLGWAPAVGKRLRESRPDILHSHGIWTHLSGDVVSYASRFRVPYVVSPHGMLDRWAVRQARVKKWIASTWFERKHLRNATCFHALCESEANAIREYGIARPTCIIPNAIDLPELDVSTTSHAKSGSDKKQLLFLGRIHPKKGLVPLIESWSELGKDSDDWQLTIAGWPDGNHQSDLERMVRELGLNERIRFSGPVFGADKDQMLRSADAFILPSFSEGLPMTVLEAWAYRLPVVMTEHCHLPDGFRQEAAFQIDPTSQSIQSELRKLFEMSDEERQKMGDRGRALVAAKFTWDIVARQYAQMYGWLMGDNEPDFLERLS